MGHIKTIQLVIIFLISMTSFELANAAFFKNEQNRVGLTYLNFSGEKYKGLIEDSLGWGIEAGADRGNRWMALTAGATAWNVTGTEAFLDGSTERNLSYLLYIGEAAAGLKFFLLPNDSGSMAIYVAGMGVFGLNYLRFSKNANLTELERAETALSSGYRLALGVDLALFSKKSKLYGEVGFRDVKSDLAKQSGFSISGLQISAGITW